MLRSCPAVSLKEKSPAQPPHPPARRPNHCGSPLPPPPPPPPPPRLTNNPAMTSPSAASGSLRPPPLPQSIETLPKRSWEDQQLVLFSLTRAKNNSPLVGSVAYELWYLGQEERGSQDLLRQH
ncbi:PREDICTED: formin-like protein 19 [Cercocebus atys]|uniref:formin-like protein 19 n=1 Tax=Cercocebus atys TaxID=9531 RepID=UPI0005F36EAC|nr:PREDICTED: formin-like protein 19 [Cercocebus atys]